MTNEPTVDEVINIIRAVVDTGQEIRGHSIVKQIDGWDSMAMVNTVLFLEERFNVEIDLPQFAGSGSINDIVAVIEQSPTGAARVWP